MQYRLRKYQEAYKSLSTVIDFAVKQFPRTKLLLDTAIANALQCMDKLGIEYEVKIGDNYLEGKVAPELLQSYTQKITIPPIQWP